MQHVQLTLVRWLLSINPRFMHTAWGFPVAQSLHFIGLTLLVGTIWLFDLRLLGVAKRIPIAALHRLVPWTLLGYSFNVVTGALFLMTEPDQYILNRAFQFKLLFMTVAGVNAAAFYLIAYRSVTSPDAGQEAPTSARIIAGVSLCCWLAVIICGRLITFYRPGPCGPAGGGFLADCFPR
jgi:hypothetical protein